MIAMMTITMATRFATEMAMTADLVRRFSSQNDLRRAPAVEQAQTAAHISLAPPLVEQAQTAHISLAPLVEQAQTAPIVPQCPSTRCGAPLR